MRSVLFLAALCQVAQAAPPGMTEEEPPPPIARAHEPAPEPPATTPPLESYRAQTILADALAGTLLFVGLNSGNEDRGQAFAKLGMTAFVVGGPIVHLSKNRGKRALGSISMRLGLPILGLMFAGATWSSDCSDFCGNNYDAMGYGLLAGALAASALDAIFLAEGEPAKLSQAAWVPTVRTSQGGLALGVSGRF